MSPCHHLGKDGGVRADELRLELSNASCRRVHTDSLPVGVRLWADDGRSAGGGTGPGLTRQCPGESQGDSSDARRSGEPCSIRRQASRRLVPAFTSSGESGVRPAHRRQCSYPVLVIIGTKRRRTGYIALDSAKHQSTESSGSARACLYRACAGWTGLFRLYSLRARWHGGAAMYRTVEQRSTF